MATEHYEHQHRGQCADWCSFCVEYLARHPKAKAHAMWYQWEVRDKITKNWLIRSSSLDNVIEYMSGFNPDLRLEIVARDVSYASLGQVERTRLRRVK